MHPAGIVSSALQTSARTTCKRTMTRTYQSKRRGGSTTREKYSTHIGGGKWAAGNGGIATAQRLALFVIGWIVQCGAQAFVDVARQCT